MSNNNSNSKKELLHDDQVKVISGGFSEKIKNFGEKLKNKIESIYINKLYVEPNADPTSKSKDDDEK